MDLSGDKKRRRAFRSPGRKRRSKPVFPRRSTARPDFREGSLNTLVAPANDPHDESASWQTKKVDLVSPGVQRLRGLAKGLGIQADYLEASSFVPERDRVIIGF